MLKRNPEPPANPSKTKPPAGPARLKLGWVAGRVDAQRWSPAGVSAHNRAFPEEMPVAFVINDEEYAVMLATPADITDFAYGFLRAEGIIHAAEEVESVVVHTRPEGLLAHIQLLGSLPETTRERRLAGVSSCGLCGVNSLRDAIKAMTRVEDGPVYTDHAVNAAMAALRDHQPYNAAAGATHAAAFADTGGRILHAREDVGRHNALDELIGTLMQNAAAPETGFVVMSSRCSYELIQKAAVYGIRLLCTASAPTALSVRLAREANITLLSLAREDSFLVLNAGERLKRSEDPSDGK